jgi:hypothetical protein
MWGKISLVFVGLAYVVLFRSLHPVGGDLLSNGSFEEARPGTNGPGGSRLTLKEGEPSARAIKDWQVVKQIAWAGDNDGPVNVHLHAADGLLFLDLTNGQSTMDPGGVKQEVFLDQGIHYEMTLRVGTHPPQFPAVLVIVTIRDPAGKQENHDCKSDFKGTGLDWYFCRFTFRTWSTTAAGAWTVQIAAPKQKTNLIGVDNVTLYRLSHTFRLR